MKMLATPLSLDDLLFGAILENEADDGEKQKTDREKTPQSRTTNDGDYRTDRHDGEEARARAHGKSGREEGDKVENDGRTGHAVPRGKLTLRGKLEGPMLGIGFWLIGRHLMTFVHGTRWMMLNDPGTGYHSHRNG